MIAGIVLLLIGLAEVIKYFRTTAIEAATNQTLTKGLLSILAGGFCVLKTEWFIATFPMITIIYGIVILMTGIAKVQLTIDMLRFQNKKWFWAAISSLISIICALVILKNPFASTALLWIFTGVSLIAEGVLDIITLIMGKNFKEGNNI